jgi:hypothetical protein
MRWANRVFAFLLAITKVNVKLAAEHLAASKSFQLNFRKIFADVLIHNSILEDEWVGPNIMMLQPFLLSGELVTITQFHWWNSAKFIQAKDHFNQQKCSSTKKESLLCLYKQ